MYDQLPIFDMPSVLDPTKSSIEEVNILKGILQSFMKLLCDQKALEELQYILNNCGCQTSGRMIERTINQVQQRQRTGQEMRLTTQIGKYDMEQVVQIWDQM